MNRRSFHKLSIGAAATTFLQEAGGWAAPADAPDTVGPKFSVMLWTLPQQLTFEQQLQMVADAATPAPRSARNTRSGHRRNGSGISRRSRLLVFRSTVQFQAATRSPIRANARRSMMIW